MNFIDKVVNYLYPIKGRERLKARALNAVADRFLNTGYSEGGGSRTKKSLRGWKARSASPKEDIDLNLFELKNRCRDLYMNAPLGRGAINTTRTNVVGPGLKLKSRIDYEFLGITPEKADKWEQNTEREFALWADSVFCDAMRQNNFYEQQQLALLSQLQSGDVFCLLKQDPMTPYMPYGLRLHLIEADRVSTPNTLSNVLADGLFAIMGTATNGNRVISGVEIDDGGGVVAYHICNRYPQSFYFSQDLVPLKWDRVEAFGKLTGRPNVLHLMESERPEQYRGVPFLAPVIEPLKQLTRYTEAELTAAVIAGFFTIFIKTEGDTTDNPWGDMIPEEDKVASGEPQVYEMGPGATNVMRPGESIEVADPKRPNTAFDGFVNALSRYIGAAVEIPQELLQKCFQSSYSAARAALLEAWKMFRMRRTWLASDFCQPIYEEWLAQAVAMGRIKAKGFFDDPIIRKAWCGSEWTGPSAGQLNPVQEVQAAAARVENGFSTREQETQEINGGNFDRNIQQAKRENELMKEAGMNSQSNNNSGDGQGGDKGNGKGKN